jgi:hypothetical protein
MSSTRADIAYHFMPGIEGQTVGFAQFAEVAPQYGPADFKVRLSGAMMGANPTNDPNSARVYLDKWGLGVLNPKVSNGDRGIQGQIQLDGKNGGEYIRMEFPTAVRLTLLTFASVSKIEDVEILADGAVVNLHALFPGTKTLCDISSEEKVWPGTVDFTRAVQQTVYAKHWDVLVRGGAAGDGIQLENVCVLPSVPEPSTLLLSSVGLLSLGFWRLRRRARQQAPVC